MLPRAGAAFVDLIPRIGAAFAAQVQGQMAPALSRVGGQLDALGTTMTRRFTLPIVAGFTVAAVKANDLNGRLREVVTLTGETGAAADAAFAEFRAGVADLSQELGVAQDVLVGGLYQALSAGVPRETVFDFLEVAGKAAIAGVTDTETAVDGLTSTINAFGLDTADAERVADSMFTAVKGGKTTFDELSSSLFQVAPTAASLGVEFTEVNAALATMTAQGIPTAQATTRLRAGMDSLIAGGEPVAAIFAEMGYESTEAAIAALGLQGSFDAVYDATGGTAEGLRDLLGRTEAVQAVQVLAGTGAEKFASELDAQADAAGAMGEAFEEVDKARALERLKVTFENLALTVGQVLLPIIEQIAGKVGEWVGRFAQLDPTLQAIAVGALAVVAAIGPLLKVGGNLLKLLGLLAAHPVILAIGLLVAGAILLYQNFEPFRDLIDGLVGYFSDFASAIGDALGIFAEFGIGSAEADEALDGLAERFGTLGELVAGIVRWFRDDLVPAIAELVRWVREDLGPVLIGIWEEVEPKVAAFVGWLADEALPLVTDALEWVRDTVVELASVFVERWDAIQEAVSNVVAIITGIISTFVRVATGLWDRFGGRIISIVEAAFGFISSIVEAAMGIITGIIDVVLGILTLDWSRAWDGIKGIVGGVWDAIFALIRLALDLISNIIGAAWGAITGAVGLAWDGILALIRGAWNAITGLIRREIDRVVGFFRGLGDTVRTLAGNIFRPITDAARNMFDAVVGFFTSLPGRLRNLIGSLASAGRDLAAGLVRGLLDALANAGGAAVDFARSVFNALAGFVNRNVVDRINRALEFRIEAFGVGVDINPPDIPQIPTMHSGGVVPGPPGAEVLRILEAGEAVLTADQQQAAAEALAGGGARRGPFRDLIVQGQQDPHTTAREVDAILGWQLSGA